MAEFPYGTQNMEHTHPHGFGGGKQQCDSEIDAALFCCKAGTEEDLLPGPCSAFFLLSYSILGLSAIGVCRELGGSG